MKPCVRSSATAEDLPNASFAGQQESYLNVRGAPFVLDAVRNAFASLYTPRAIRYRIDMGFAHESVALSVGVQKMVRSDKASAGVIFTLDPDGRVATWNAGAQAFNGYTPAEILGQPIGTVKSHVHRAVRILRRILGPQLGRIVPTGDAHAML